MSFVPAAGSAGGGQGAETSSRWNDDGPAGNAPGSQRIVRSDHVIQNELLDLCADAARAREGQHLGELSPRAPEWQTHGHFERNRAVTHRQRTAAEADDRNVTAR